MMRKFVVVLCLALLVLGLPGAPITADEGTANVSMAVQSGFGGRFKFGEWLPVFVTVDNAGPNLNGEIRVIVTNQSGQLNFIAPAELPAGARKRFTLYVLPNNFSRTVKVELVQDDHILLTGEARLSVLPNDRYTIGLVAAESTGVMAMNPPQLPGRRERSETVTLSLDEIPERMEGLRLLNALILNDLDTSLLSPEQHNALRGWVMAGGRLIIGGGAGAARTLTGLPVELQPAILNGQQEVEVLSTLETYTGEPIRVPGPFLVTRARPAEGAVVLLSQEAAGKAIPLVIERTLGEGYVDFVTLDLSHSPFDAWAGTSLFARQLLAPGAAWPDYLAPDVSPVQMSDSQMTYALSSLPALDLPSIRLLGLLLAGYILLVGPVNYFLLRRFDRLAWAWVTIPILTLIFSGLAYAISFSQRGGDIIVNQISLIEASQDGQAGRSRTFIGIFSPRRQAYDVQVNSQALLRPLGENYDPWRGSASTGNNLSLIQGNPARVRGLTVNQWSLQSFVAETTLTGSLGLAGQLFAGRDHLYGQLSNQSSITWQDAAIIFSGQFQKLGDLEPGETAEVRLNFNDERSTVTGYGSYMLFQDEMNRPGGASRKTIFKQTVLDGAIFNNALRRFNQPLFLAWQEDSPLQVSLSDSDITSQRTSLVYGQLPVSFEGPRVAIPPGFSRVETLATTGDAGVCNYYGQSWIGYHLFQGAVETRLALPDTARGVQPERLDLYIRTDGGWVALPAIEMYDRLAEQWVLLEEAKVGMNSIFDLQRFYDKDSASVQLRISQANAGQGGGCLFFDLAMEGERL